MNDHSPIIIDQHFDQEFLTHLSELRTMRLCESRRLLINIDHVAKVLEQRQVLDDHGRAYSKSDITNELNERIAMLTARLREPKTVYEDELHLYADCIR